MIIIPRPHFYLSVGQPARNKFLRACKRQKYIKHTVFIRLTAWALVKFLDLESGRFFEAGCLLNFTTLSKCIMFILQQNNVW